MVERLYHKFAAGERSEQYMNAYFNRFGIAALTITQVQEFAARLGFNDPKELNLVNIKGTKISLQKASTGDYFEARYPNAGS